MRWSQPPTRSHSRRRRGRLIYPDGRLQEAGGILRVDAHGWTYAKLSLALIFPTVPGTDALNPPHALL